MKMDQNNHFKYANKKALEECKPPPNQHWSRKILTIRPVPHWWKLIW